MTPAIATPDELLDMTEPAEATGEPGLDRDERLIWRILARLESLALRKYESVEPQLVVPEKKTVVGELLSRAPDDSDLNMTPLGQSVSELLAAADRSDRTDTLLVQGFVLERLGQVIYRVLGQNAATSPLTRSVATVGSTACAAVMERASDLVRQAVGGGEALFDRFCTATDSVLRRLDAVGSDVEQMFGQRFGLTFSELIGEFTADLLPACVELGMNRRKLVCHLAAVFMGG